MEWKRIGNKNAGNKIFFGDSQFVVVDKKLLSCKVKLEAGKSLRHRYTQTRLKWSRKIEQYRFAIVLSPRDMIHSVPLEQKKKHRRLGR